MAVSQEGLLVTPVDTTGDPCTDDVNDAIRVNVVAGGGGGGAVTIADGADVNAGSTTDAAITSDTNGTLSAKLRGLIAILADVWDNGANLLRVSIQNATLAVTQSGVWTVARSWTLSSGTDSVNVGNFPVSQTVVISQTGTDNNVDANITNASLAVTQSGAWSTGRTWTLGSGTDSVTIPGTVDVNVTNASLAVTGPLTDAQLRATPVDVTGSFSAATAADVYLPETAATYVAGDTGKNLTQTPDGSLRILVKALVSEAIPTAFVDGEIKSLSLTSEGRLRVSSVPARTEIDFFPDYERCTTDVVNSVYNASISWQ